VVTYTGDLTDNLQLSISAGENKFNRTTEPATADIPVIYQNAGGNWTALGGWTAFSIDSGEDIRESMRLDLTWSVGDHLVEVGMDREENTASAQTINSGGVYWMLHPLNDNLSYQCDTTTQCPAGANARKRTYNSGGSFDVESTAFYIQDTWQVNDRLSLELGLRNETFTNFNAEGNEFVKVDDQWAPRLSVAWDPTGDGDKKLFASYGYYYLPIAANTNIRLSGAETYIHEWYDWDGTMNADYTPTGLGAIYRTDVFGTGDVPDTRSVVDSGLEAMYQSELIVGYEFVDDNGFNYGIKGMYRNLETSIEDVAIDAAVISHYNSSGSWDASLVGGDTVEEVFGGFHQYVLANPGESINVYIPEQDEFVTFSADALGYPQATRQYGSVEMTFERPFDGVWNINASYVWSHSWGNNEGYVRSDNGQDDAGLTTNFDQPGLTDHGSGDLPNDRRHTIKVFGNYQLANGIRFGGNLLWQTGRPKGCFGVHPTDTFAAQYGDESFYCDGKPVPRGSLGRTENIMNLDLNAQYLFEMGDSELLVSLDIFNVFNNQAVTEVREQEGIPFGKPTSYQTPLSYRLGLRYRY